MKGTTANLIALLDQTYPGLNTFFESPVRDDGSQKWCKKNGYNFRASKASEIYEKSKELVSMLPKCPSTKLLIQEAITQLNSVFKAVEVFRAEMLRRLYSSYRNTLL